MTIRGLFLRSVFSICLAGPALASVDSVLVGADFDEVISSTDIAPSSEKLLDAKPEDVNRAKVVAIVNKSAIGSTAQTVRVYVDGQLTYQWKVSTGREKFEKAKSGRSYTTTTPVGYFRPYLIKPKHHSITWNADIYNVVFFIGGVAIHATSKDHYAELGRRASGGCTRLHADHAKIFFDLVKSAGVKKVESISRDGKTAVNKKGEPVLTNAYDVLIIVENKI